MDKKITPPGQIIKGYKATDENMCCQPNLAKPPFQFELGKWYTVDGDSELSLCRHGFHFCEHPSGPWAYYKSGRLFEIEAEECLLSVGTGASLKHVCKKIRLVKEIVIDGHRNTGQRNVGNENAGNGNSGHKNIGDENTGDRNTGQRNVGNENAGDRNTGHKNTGYWNTGHWNTGYKNTGHWNTGDENIGDRNTGHKNTGHWNTGHGNAGNNHSGCLNYGEAPFYLFNQPAERSSVNFNLVNRLSNLLRQDYPIDPSDFLSLPNATPEAIQKLHEEHIKARKKLLPCG
jgi:hypothetical protein